MDAPSIEWGKLSAGVFGALISARWLKGVSWTEKVVMVVSGIAVSYYATPWTAQTFHAPEGLVGFLLGMFGMSIVSKIYEFIQAIDARAVWSRVWARIEGLIGGGSSHDNGG